MAEKPNEKPESKTTNPPDKSKSARKEAAAEAKGEKPAKTKNTAKPAEADSAAPTAPLTAADVLGESDAAKPAKIVRAKGSKNIVSGIVHITASFNNTTISITDPAGNVIGWSSAGRVGFHGSRKSTAFAAQQAAQDAARQGMSHGLREVEVRLKGPGSGREAAVRAIAAVGLEITTIKDVTPVPHNGCRPRKKRRV
jgi:small subunit ribosomal protein S11